MPAPDAILAGRIRAHLSTRLRRLPNFTCLETIERSRRRLPAKRFELIDIARLEVALVEGKELFAWPGSGKFDEREIRELLPGGASGNGSFALHARSVFLGPHTVFEREPDTELDGRPAHHFRYRVAQPFSGFTLRMGQNSAVVGYDGEFWVTKETLELMRLIVRARDIPPVLEFADHSEQLDYQLVKIGENAFMLPRSSDLHMTGKDGVESRNLMHFSACKQYSTESVLSFDDPDETAAKLAAEAASRRPPVAGGLELELVIQTHLTLGQSAVGDFVTAEVARDVKQNKQVMVPKGALLKGRLLHFERRGMIRIGNIDRELILLGFDFEEISTRDWRAPVYGTMREVMLWPIDPRLTSRQGPAGEVFANYHPSGHNLAVVYNDQRLRGGLRIVWSTRGEPLKPAR